MQAGRWLGRRGCRSSGSVEDPRANARGPFLGNARPAISLSMLCLCELEQTALVLPLGHRFPETREFGSGTARLGSGTARLASSRHVCRAICRLKSKDCGHIPRSLSYHCCSKTSSVILPSTSRMQLALAMAAQAHLHPLSIFEGPALMWNNACPSTPYRCRLVLPLIVVSRLLASRLLRRRPHMVAQGIYFYGRRQLEISSFVGDSELATELRIHTSIFRRNWSR